MAKRYLFLTLLTCCAIVGQAKVKLSHLISDGMVIQQNSEVRLWGWDTPGKMIKVRTSWSPTLYTARAAADSTWMVKIHSPKASYKPLSITFNDGSANFKLKGGQTISIKDLPVGADYEVEEVGANSLDFLTYADNQKGVISKNSEENLVRFKNVRNVLPETGSYGNILLIGGSAFFLLLGFTVLLLRKREKNETK